MEEESKRRWFYAEVSDAEDWRGPHDSEAEAIAEAREAYDGERENFWVDEALPVDWQKVFASFADADRVLEDLGDYIGDNEHVEDPEPEYLTSKAEAQAALEAWYAAHVKMRPYYHCVGNPKGYLVSELNGVTDCPSCGGSGSIPNGTDEMACGSCTGSGRG